MGRSGRSRKRKDAMNRVKRERNAKKELARLKKTLGLVDADGNDIKMELDGIAEVKTAAQLKKVPISGRKSKMYFSAVTVQNRLYAIEETNGQFYRIDLVGNGKKLKMVCLEANASLGVGHYELLLKS